MRLSLASQEEKWALAIPFERSNSAAREAVEDWYLSVLGEQPCGMRSTEVYFREHDSTVNNRQPTVFYFNTEARQKRAADRLAGMGSTRAIAALLRNLEESNLDLPLVDNTFLPGASRSPGKTPLSCLHYTARALSHLGAPAVLPLSKALLSDKVNVRLQAVLALSRMGKEAAPATPALILVLKDGDWNLRHEALKVLLELDPEGKVLVPVLLELVRKDPGPDWAIVTLARLGKKSEEAAHRLCELLLDTTNESKVRRNVAQALGDHELNGKSVVKALVDVLSDADEIVRYYAVCSLNKVRAHDPVVIEALTERLRADSHMGVRQAAAIALGERGLEADSAVPALKAALKDENGLLREYSKKALGRIEADLRSQ